MLESAAIALSDLARAQKGRAGGSRHPAQPGRSLLHVDDFEIFHDRFFAPARGGVVRCDIDQENVAGPGVIRNPARHLEQCAFTVTDRHMVFGATPRALAFFLADMNSQVTVC